MVVPNRQLGFDFNTASKPGAHRDSRRYQRCIELLLPPRILDRTFASIGLPYLTRLLLPMKVTCPRFSALISLFDPSTCSSFTRPFRVIWLLLPVTVTSSTLIVSVRS